MARPYKSRCLGVQVSNMLSLILLALLPGTLAEDRCALPIIQGRCLALIQRYAFNKHLNKCVRFDYGGCDGNENNFRSLEECQSICESERKDKDVCAEPLEKGPCMAMIKRYGYDKKQKKCVRFIYGGCRGNKNNFESLPECESKCEQHTQSSKPDQGFYDFSQSVVFHCSFAQHPSVAVAYSLCTFDNKLGSFRNGEFIDPRRKTRVWGLMHPEKRAESTYGSVGGYQCRAVRSNAGEVEPLCNKDVCAEPLEAGPCMAMVKRYGYDPKQKKCVMFIYGGCRGNKNNFESLPECKSKCEHSQPSKPARGKEACSLSIQKGPCRARKIRYAYNRLYRKCVPFTYGGCLGNANNFESLNECKRICTEPEHHAGWPHIIPFIKVIH